MSSDNVNMQGDLLYGVPAIAKHLNMRTRQVYHLAANHGLPVFKIGGKTCAKKSALAAWIDRNGERGNG